MGIRVNRVSAMAVALLMAMALTGVVNGASVAAASAKWAWIVVRHPKSDQPLSPKDRGNSSGGVNTFVRIFDSPGWYGVILPGVQPDGGETANVLVSALGKDPKLCVSHQVQYFSDEAQLQVLCYSKNGVPADSGFVVNWLAASGTGGRLGYATDFSPTSNCGTPQDRYASLGGSISSCPLAGQRARVVVPKLGSYKGTVQVSARATLALNDETGAGFCGLAAMGPGGGIGGDQWLDAQCFEPDGGAEIYRTFTVWFMQGLGMKGIVRKNVAYLLAHKPKASSYVPEVNHRFSSAGKAGRVSRSGTGRYVVTLPGMPLGGSAQVTPFGSGVRHCVISGIRTGKLPQRVGVRCFNATGAPADSRFMLAYAR
jgi:hypothetical protein